MDSLAGQVQLGSDAIVAKQRDKDIGVCTCAVDVSGDGHHLIDCHVIEHRMHECIINEEDIHTSVNNSVKRPDEQWLRSWSEVTITHIKIKIYITAILGDRPETSGQNITEISPANNKNICQCSH